MKLSLSLYLLGCLQLSAINSFFQNKISLDVKDTHLEIIMQLIESQTEYHFIYNNDAIKTNQKLDITVFKEDLDETLQLLFKRLSIKYTLKKNHIILSTTKQNNTQEKFTLSGTIKDAATGETLLGANIIIKDKSKGVITNEYGFYSITLLNDSYFLQASFMGYETKEIEIVLDQNRKLNIELQPSANELDEVIISSESKSKSQVQSTLLGVVKMRGVDIKKLPALLGEPDVTRAILTQPGVSSVGEGASGFNVRGGNIDQNLILLDEAPIYNSSHVWGFFSIFNSDAIKNLKLYKGGIPARFGGRASSVLDIRQREGSNKKFKGEGGLGLLFSRLTLEGPIKKDKISYLISGRRSYFDLFFPLLGDEVKKNRVYFYDLNTKLTWNINDNNKLFASGYFGADVMKLNFDGYTQEDGTKTADEKINFQWKNATATVRWNHLFSDRLFMNLSGIYSQYNYSLSSQDDSGGGPAGTSGSFTWKSSVENWIFKPDFTFYQSPSSKIRFGINNTLYKFTPAKISSTEEGTNTVNFETEKGLEVAPYIEYEKKEKKFSINAGLRYSWFGNIGPHKVTSYDPAFSLSVSSILGTEEFKKGKVIKNYSGFEPRLSLKYNLNDRKALKIGYNRVFQYVHLISNTAAALPFDIWKPSGTHIKPLEVNQFSSGYAYDTSNNIYNLSFEGYYKTFKNMLEYKNGADLFINKNLETQLLPADGYSYGAEIGLHKNKGKLKGNVNYTYSVTKRKTTSSFINENINGGTYYPSNYDKPHFFNLTANYKLSEKWSLGTFFTYQTGRPTTQPTGRIVVDGITHLTYSDRNAYRIPDTHRLDLSFNYTPKGNPNTKWESNWSFGLYNAYGHKNAFSTYSSFNNNQLKTFQFSVIGSPIPFITYNFKF
ncbi:MAG: TonB-dependent receptor [Cellulophaga sp.]